MRTSAEVATLAYHDVADDPATSGFQRPGARAFKHSWRTFMRHLDGMDGLGLRPGPVSALDLRQGGRHVLLTFDDGGRSAAGAGDELSRRGWTGHFFIVTSLIGHQTFLAAEDIRHLHRCGHVIGSHSHTHPDIFKRQTRAQMLREWVFSAGILADLLGAPCTTASVPGGDISRAVLDSGASAGFSYLFTSEPVLSPQQVEACWVLGRGHIKAGTSPERVRALAACRGWRRELWVRRAKGLARTLGAPLYVRYVRLRTRPQVSP